MSQVPRRGRAGSARTRYTPENHAFPFRSQPAPPLRKQRK